LSQAVARSFIALTAYLIAFAPRHAQAQGRRTCGTDSTFAKTYGAHLQSTFRSNDAEKATVSWLPDSASCDSAMRVDSSGPGHRIYVYSLTEAGVIRYGLLSVPPPETHTSSTVCFYDAAWRRRGVCLGEVQ